jgi:thymidylate synthase (FAD)
VIGSDYSFKDQPWNEISGRYVELEHEVWRPDSFRIQSKNNKQASVAGSVVDENEAMVALYNQTVDTCYSTYKTLIASGVSKEQARAVLPVSFYTEWYWTASLQALAHMVNLRDHEHAQIETRDFAQAVDKLISELYPHGWKHMRGVK